MTRFQQSPQPGTPAAARPLRMPLLLLVGLTAITAAWSAGPLSTSQTAWGQSKQTFRRSKSLKSVPRKRSPATSRSGAARRAAAPRPVSGAKARPPQKPSVVPSPAPITTPEARKPATPRDAGVICWMWHRRGRLQNTGATTSVLGLYDSTDPRIQRAHIEMWKQAGLTFVAGSWWGKGGDAWYQHIDDAFAGYLQRCEGLGFKICIYWEDVPGNNLDRTLRAIARYASSPAYYKRNGLPVLFVYSRVYEKVGLDVLTALSDRYFLVLDRPPVRKLPAELPLGCHWFGVPWTDPEHLLRQYMVVRDNPNWELFPLIFHGFDNTAARDPGTRWPTSGSSVEWFQKQLRLALSADPEHLMFPWNEMAEHSAFEPTVEFGRTYYDAMAKAVAEFVNRP